MERIFAALCLLLAGSAAASASSFVTLPALETPLSRSMVMRGEDRPAAIAAKPAPAVPAPAVVAPPVVTVESEEPVTISASIIAFGTPAPAKPAAVAQSTREPEHLPSVMRGGLLGEARIRTAPAEIIAPVENGPNQSPPARKTPSEPTTPQPNAATPPVTIRQPE